MTDTNQPRAPEQLKPCPFCGGEAELSSDMGMHEVVCANQDVCGGTSGSWESKSQALRAWNSRTALPPSRDAAVEELVSALDEIAYGTGCTQTYSGCRDECRKIARAALERMKQR